MSKISNMGKRIGSGIGRMVFMALGLHQHLVPGKLSTPRFSSAAYAGHDNWITMNKTKRRGKFKASSRQFKKRK